MTSQTRDTLPTLRKQVGVFCVRKFELGGISETQAPHDQKKQTRQDRFFPNQTVSKLESSRSNGLITRIIKVLFVQQEGKKHKIRSHYVQDGAPHMHPSLL